MKVQLSSVLLAVSLILTPTAFAGPLEHYQQLLTGNQLTIKYEAVVPLPRGNNKHKVEIHGKSGMNLDNAHFLTNRQFKGLVVIAGEDKYEEITTDKLSLCRLIKGDKVYFFSRDNLEDKPVYYGNEGKGKVSASGRNLQAEFFSGASYADPELTRCLNALLPKDLIPVELPYYERIKNGHLGENLTYDDFYTHRDNYEEGIRFYYRKEQLVKISSIALERDQQGRESSKRVLFNIKEFSPKIDTRYLSLPPGLKDTSK